LTRSKRRAALAADAGFDHLGLSETMLAALRRAAYEKPTPVQAGLIPRAMAGADVVGQARTGTGKTAAFVIPILERIKGHRPGPQALVLTPTRELAMQVCGELDKLAYGRKVRGLAVYGGKPIRGQIEALRRGADVVVGTPGRILDHLGRKTLDLSHVVCVVLDEADRMLDIGFRPDIERILRVCPRDRQTLLLSATVPPPIERLAHRYMRDPETLDFSADELAGDTIDQYYFTVDNERKAELLVRLLEREQPQQAIVFCRTKRRTDLLFRRLQKRGADVACIHGDMEQSQRDRVMRGFRDGKIRVLIATDIVGRGIDVTSISHIINFDIPQFCDDYVHRVGRTGRMGREGVAYCFVTPEEGHELTRIEQRINRLLHRDEIEGFPAVTLPAAAIAPEQQVPESPKPPPLPASLLRRPPKRYRRGL
jgi:ATP-dependent RNA helicase DeaD